MCALSINRALFKNRRQNTDFPQLSTFSTPEVTHSKMHVQRPDQTLAHDQLQHASLPHVHATQQDKKSPAAQNVVMLTEIYD